VIATAPPSSTPAANVPATPPAAPSLYPAPAPSVYWNPALRTGTSGVLTFTIQLPR